MSTPSGNLCLPLSNTPWQLGDFWPKPALNLFLLLPLGRLPGGRSTQPHRALNMDGRALSTSAANPEQLKNTFTAGVGGSVRFGVVAQSFLKSTLQPLFEVRSHGAFPELSDLLGVKR